MSPLIQQITVPNPRPEYADVHIRLYQWPGVDSPYTYQVTVNDNIGYCLSDERFTLLADARSEFASQVDKIESDFQAQSSPACPIPPTACAPR